MLRIFLEYKSVLGSSKNHLYLALRGNVNDVDIANTGEVIRAGFTGGQLDVYTGLIGADESEDKYVHDPLDIFPDTPEDRHPVDVTGLLGGIGA